MDTKSATRHQSPASSGRHARDVEFMRLALRLARRGKSSVSPNPLVGCVIVSKNRPVGRGFHEFFGGPHAEVNALLQAASRAKGSTMYVTLEPCNHRGKTPPCTEAIIRAGVSRVVIACRDPNPKMNGQGIARLRQHSIRVKVGVLARDARILNRSYMTRQHRLARSVIVKYAMSADGKIATREGDSKWISSVQSRRLVHSLRSQVDGIVVGAKTVLRDDPDLTSHGNGNNPVRIVIDPQLRIPLNRRMFKGAAPTIVVHDSNTATRKLALLAARRVLTVRIPVRKGRMNFGEIIGKLNDFSLFNILIEGGGNTIASALEDGVVTDIKVFIAPKIIGGESAVTPVAGIGVTDIGNAYRLLRSSIRQVGCDYLLEAKVAQPAQKKGR